MQLYGKSDVGLVRKSNQDRFAYGELPGESAWLVVCDGMGGANGGNVASKIAVDRISWQFKSTYWKNISSKGIKNIIITAIYNANRAIYQQAQSDPTLRGMGTTVVTAIVRDGRAYLAHAGDSRAYLASDSKLTRITTDHSIVQELVSNGDITEEEARIHPQKNIITRVLGVEPTVEIDYQELELLAGDRLLLCTDGLTNYVEEKDILRLSVRELEECCDLLISMAKDSGGGDNITVAALKY